MVKGFGEKKEKREKSSGQVDREEKASKYDEVATQGGQEYKIFVRQFGSDDDSWLPCGSIAVPRGAQIADAVFANEEGIKTSIVRTYPKLRGYVSFTDVNIIAQKNQLKMMMDANNKPFSVPFYISCMLFSFPIFT